MYELPQNEKILKVVRKYWLFLALQVTLLIIVWLVPLVAVWQFSYGFEIGNNVITVSQSLIILFFCFWTLAVWFRLFYIWTEYYLDTWVITNKRIISIRQNGFFNRQVSNFRIEKIQDTVTKIEGLIETFFDYGDIEVQTAGETGDFTISNVPSPVALKELISKIQDEVSHEVVFQERGF